MYYGLNRTLCDVLADMRAYIKIMESPQRNKNILLSLVEETQIMGNRMEANLQDQHDWEALKQDIKKLKAEYKILRRKVKSNDD